MGTFGIERKKVYAVFHNDTNNDVQTIFDLETGGPIISDSSLDAAKYKFENAIRLGSAVRNLLYFGKVTKVKAKTPKKLRFPADKITDVTYQEMIL
jgi:hypothetical protein